MKLQNETALVRACLDLLRLKGIFAWRNQTTGTFDPTKGRFRTFQGLKGTSDILGILDGRLLALECKVGKNKLSPDQESFLQAVERHGGIGYVVWSVEELESFLRDHGVGEL